MNDLILNKVYFNSKQWWTIPIPSTYSSFLKKRSCVSLFDHNGYDLCPIEKKYALYNTFQKQTSYRGIHTLLKKDWFTQPYKRDGYVLNHSMLLERKGFHGEALDQLRYYAKTNPMLYKVINYQSKWGIDISIDYVKHGNSFELFHYEYDSFDFNKINQVKTQIEYLVNTVDFNDVARDLQKRKQEWYHLEFFDQSKWKTSYFGIEPERFKMVGWQKSTDEFI